MKYRLKRRLLGLFLAALAVEFMAFNSLLVWLYLVAAMILSAIVLGLVGPLVSLHRTKVSLVSCRRDGEFQPPLAGDAKRIFAGDSLVMVFAGSIPVERITSATLSLNNSESLKVNSIQRVRGGTEMRTAPVRRGTLGVTSVNLTSDWPTAVASITVKFPLQQSLTVCPQYQLLKSRAGATSPEPVSAINSRGSGDGFLGLREYQTGDTRRRIHWYTTARSGQLMVVETARQVDANVEISLLMEEGASEQACDLAASVAATLAGQAVRAEIPFVVYVGRAKGISSWSAALLALAQSAPSRAQRGQATVCARGQLVLISERGVEHEVVATTPLSAVCELLQ